MAGRINAVIGSAIVLAALVYAATGRGGSALPIGLAVAIMGALPLVSGLGRMTSRMEITSTGVAWTWSFSKHELAFHQLADAALVEKGSPASGDSWMGFLGAGITGVLALWLFDTLLAVVRSTPSLGSVELVLIRRYGGPVEVTPISAWSNSAALAQANEALVAVQAAIAEKGRPTSRRLPILRDDAWNQPGPRPS